MTEGRRYRVEGVLGQGGFGTVYKAQLLGEGGFTRTVALKVLNADMEGMEDVARRLRDEARLLGLLRHRAILQVDGLVRMNGRWTIVMEYIDGADLQKVSRAAVVPLGPALEIIGECASALHVAYTTPSPSGVPLHLLHRDIKPPNLLLTSAGEVKVLDFGIARAEFGDREAKTKSVMYGSVGYMAPERMDFEELPEGDVYALGAVLYEILVGQAFGKASIRAEKHQAMVDAGLDLIRRKLGPLPPDFPELLRAMLAYDPEERPTAREVERRCRAIRQTVDGPWLRDWAEQVVPPIVVGRELMPAAELSGNILTESGGVSMIGEMGESVAPKGVASTMPLEAEKSVGAPPVVRPAPAVRDVPPKSPAPRPARSPRGNGSAWIAGLGMVGCTSLAVAAVVLVGLFALILLSIDGPATPGTYVLDSGGLADGDGPEIADPSTTMGVPVGGGTPPSGDGPFLGAADYGPPLGPVFRAERLPPWNDPRLPVHHGAVIYNDDKMVSVMYKGGPPAPLADDWARVLQKNWGWQPGQSYDTDTSALRMMTHPDGRQLNLSTAQTMGNLVLSASIQPASP